MVPAPGQGALAVEIRGDRKDLLDIVGRLDHKPTRLCVEFERAFLKAAGGGCSTPLGAWAQALGSSVELTVFWSEADGSRARRLTQSCESQVPRDTFVARLAAQVKAH